MVTAGIGVPFLCRGSPPVISICLDLAANEPCLFRRPASIRRPWKFRGHRPRLRDEIALREAMADRSPLFLWPSPPGGWLYVISQRK